MIKFKCSGCGKQLRVKDDAAGKKGKCPQCGKELTVPDAEFIELQAADRPAAPPPPPPTHANPHSKPVPPSRPSATARKHRRWVIVLLVAAVIAIPFAPKFPLWIGIVLLGLCVLALVPKVSAASRWLLRLPQDRRWVSGLRVTMYALIGLVLVLGGVGGAQFKAEQDRIAAEQAAKEAEQRRLTAEANETVATLAREAQEHWKSGQTAIAEDKLHQAERTQHATNLAPVKQLRTRMANARVEAVMQEAVDAVKNADLALAQRKVQEALAIPNATALDEPRHLQGQIAKATDSEHIKNALMGLSNEAFEAFQESGELPAALESGYDTLDGRTLEIAQAIADEVAAAREKRRQERIAQERAAAEAARKAEEERKAREVAAARAKAEAEAAEKARFEKGMGETLTIGYTSYVVWRAHWSDRLSSNQFLNKRPNAKWLFLDVSVRNNDKKARTIPPFKLVDEQGREYESSSDAMMIENAIGVFDRLNPDVTKQGYVVFDVPSNRTYKLKLSGGYWSTETGYIRIEPKSGQ